LCCLGKVNLLARYGLFAGRRRPHRELVELILGLQTVAIEERLTAMKALSEQP
jgi:hypothetical protein